MATEEQTSYVTTIGMYSGSFVRAGQKLTISERTVSKLSLVLKKYGSPAGNITFIIRRVSDDGVICSKVWADASGLTTSPDWYEVTFDTPEAINEEVRICAEFAGGDINNQVVLYVGSDLKANENSCWYATSWKDGASDAAYIYTYEEPAPPAAGGGPAALVAAGII